MGQFPSFLATELSVSVAGDRLSVQQLVDAAVFQWLFRAFPKWDERYLTREYANIGQILSLALFVDWELAYAQIQ
ncbi:MAG: hypothetical protein KME06_05195 [Kastovskya adunca ATA6-11-RM4]|jgi:hypothetical protein|nr:hypothetical protein [Kastovskya adunca ATA6-11-RM4]